VLEHEATPIVGVQGSNAKERTYRLMVVVMETMWRGGRDRGDGDGAR